ncbi:MAG: hypothetical protein J0I04_00990 [Paenarthrobacter ureafaciens]|uniref:hypothetical protein n=1 Tax=Paenarthrobacter ureafaciens TaxID=37931 RepID=UPI001AC14AAF|nr:hypothetical protein [Paenarthrobacter ureafaciens]MBN9128217.1 hypothetical protein [Paenarthrobacter ureafaciens]BCW83324.1 hypothetical protein NicSoilE8_09970 [Arthrobacter sp. NicSoilE8]
MALFREDAEIMGTHFTKKHVFSYVASTTIALAGIAGLSGCAGSPEAGVSSSPGATVGMDASWAEGYDNLRDLKAHSSIAVEGSFTRIIDESSIKTVPITDFEFTVDKVLHDPPGSLKEGTRLTVRQTGGYVDGVLHQISDDPLFKISESAVLFLKEPEPGLFYVVGGPSGRFEVINGKVTPFDVQGTKVDGTLEDFAAAVKGS